MTKKQLSNWKEKARGYEETIVDFHRKAPDRKPDGSFAMQLVKWAYAAGKRDARKERGQ